jgi:hypothetical protein
MRDVPTGHETDAVTGPGRYEIRVQGHLAPRWAAWFEGMTLARQDDGTTVIHGAVADQAALHGLFRRLSDIGLPLVSVIRTAGEPPADPADQNPSRSTT